MHIHDKILLRKRTIVESVYDELKDICQIEHTRPEALKLYIQHDIGLNCLHFLPIKPTLNIEIIYDKQISSFALIELTLY